VARVSSKAVERKLLALFFVPPYHVKVLDLDTEYFAFEKHRDLARLIKQYVVKYKSAPTKQALISFANTKVINEKSIEKIPDALSLLSDLPKVRTQEAPYYFERAENYKVGRSICDLHDYITKSLKDNEVDFNDLRKVLIQNLLLMGKDEQGIKRGMIYDTVRDRWDQYKKTAKGVQEDVIPYGMRDLDNYLGGMRKSFVTLIYSKTGGGKSRFGINVAYNAAVAGHNVMFVSLEMAYDLLANCFDSRIGAIDSHKIIFGKLEKQDKKCFVQALKKQALDKLNVYISDIPQGATVSKIYQEIEIYESIRGCMPDLVIIDYANLLEPDKRYRDRSERYDNLLLELKQMSRVYNLSSLTMMQESRDATQAMLGSDKKKKEVDGVHNIGLSNYAAIHCETVLRLKQTERDALQNRLRVSIDKYRYGASQKEIQLLCLFDRTYIGDRVMGGIPVVKE